VIASYVVCSLNYFLHVYSYTCTGVHVSIYNSDEDFLIIFQLGPLHIVTEFGGLYVEPLEIAVTQVNMIELFVKRERYAFKFIIHELLSNI